jgi:hypothetical protein
MEEKRSGLSPFLLIGIGIVIFLAVASYFLITFLTGSASDKPEVKILKPTSPQTISVGDSFSLATYASSSQGLQRVEFYVDQALLSQQASRSNSAIEMLAEFIWVPEAVGAYDLSFIAYGAQNEPSERASIPIAVTAPDSTEEEKQHIQEDIASLPMQHIAELAEESSGQERTDEHGIVFDDQDLLNLPDQGQNGDASPSIRIDDASERQAGGVNIKGRVVAEDDVGLDRLYFGFLSEGMQAEIQTVNCAGLQRCEYVFNYQLDEGERTIAALAVDSAQQPSGTATRSYQATNGEGEGGVAIVVEVNINIHGLQLFDDQIEQEEIDSKDDFGAPRITGYGCSGNVVKIGVPYRYYSNHGRQVYVIGLVVKDGNLIAAGWGNVEYYTNGLAILDMELIPGVEEGIVTDQIKLMFSTGQGEEDSFYSEIADLTITWPVPKPDLHISDVVRSINGESVDVTVENLGCSPVDGFDIALHTGNGEVNKFASFEESLSNGSSKTFSIGGLDPNLYSQTFDAYVDPDNAIEELDETNNVHLTFPIRVKYIHFYKIDIHDTSDDEWHQNPYQGEFRLYVKINGIQEERPRNTDMAWLLPKGSYDIDEFIGPIMISPGVEWNHDMYMGVVLRELDDLGDDDWDHLSFMHSADMNDVNSWKRNHGQDFSAISEKGRFTIHWWVVLED